MALKFTRKIFIRGEIKVLTGLHIGGAKSALDIGEIDLNVTKTANGKIPFIPGSSLKGKLRSILAREEGIIDIKKDSDNLKLIFGYSGDDKEEEKKEDRAESEQTPTRLLVRDSFLNEAHFHKLFSDKKQLVSEYTESKWENTVDRLRGTAENPREIERVPAGAKFNFEMVYNCYNDRKTRRYVNMIVKAMRILEDDYLGGNGSRGYGKIQFCNVEFTQKTLRIYRGDNQAVPYNNSYSFETCTQ